MEATPATSNAPDMTGTDGKKGRALAGKRPSATGPRNGQVSARAETGAQEDWSLATADPAFWLKEIG